MKFHELIIRVFFIASCGESYSWYSTLWELRNLTLLDTKIVNGLEDRLIEGSTALNQLLSQVQFLKNRCNQYLKDNEKDHGVIFEDYRRWLDGSLPPLNASFPFNYTILEADMLEMKPFPKQSDLDTVTKILLDLSNTHKLKAKDLARGHVFGHDTGSPMSAKSVSSLATASCKRYSMDQCVEWCEVARNRVGESNREFTIDDVDKLEKVRIKNDAFSKLCKLSVNNTYIKDWHKSGLVCYLWNNNRHPFLVLQPVRVEQISMSPLVILFYDVIKEEQIVHLKQRALPKLKEALTYRTEKLVDMTNYRVTHNCWIDDSDDASLVNLEGFMEAITGLTTRGSSEELQVANYGIGGHYMTHTDAMDPHMTEVLKNREATFMYYLSDVEVGGATAFIELGVAVKPVKKAAVFWYNLKRNAVDKDYNTSHGACPVILGDKWVANKWIRQNPRSKCRLQ